MAKTYRMVRLPTETADQLSALVDLFERDHVEGRAEHTFDERTGKPTLSYVVQVLIDHYWDKRQRGRDERLRQTIAEAIAVLRETKPAGKPLSALCD